MPSTRIAKLLLLFALAATPFCAAQQAQNQPLQFSIQQTSTFSPILQATLRNAGKQTLQLFLGSNGDQDSIRLSITDDKDKTLLLEIRLRPIGGQIFLKDTSLAPGATYSLLLNLDKYDSVPYAPREHWLPALAIGRHTIQATYIGRPPEVRPIGPDGVPSETPLPSPYWAGTVTSNTLPFTIPQKADQ